MLENSQLERPKKRPSLAAIRVQKDGCVDRRRVGRYFHMVGRKSRTDYWELTGPSFGAIIGTKHSLFSDPFPLLYRSA